MALRIGRLGPARKVKLSCGLRPLGASSGRDDDNPTGGCGLTPSLRNELSTQNWSGQGESDSLIKTKHCDGLKTVLTQCDFCPVL
jgi:hypothetical protein